MPVALIIGEYNPGDAIIETFKTMALQLGYDIAEVGYDVSCPCPTDSDKDGFLLFCVSITLRSPAKFLSWLKPCGKRTIVYVHTSRASADEAIRYSHEKLAHGYVVNGDGSSGKDRLNSFRDLVWRLHTGHPPYGRIAFDWESCPHPIAFVSTPFDRDNRVVMEQAVHPALTKLGFTVEWADRDYRLTLHDSIRENIKRSALLIANVSLDQRDLNHNPNVYFEAGIGASDEKRPIIFVRRNGETSIHLPADIGGRRWLGYDNEIDLALKLYHGLKRHVT